MSTISLFKQEKRGPMRVVVNGQEAEIEPGTSVAALVARYKLQPRHVAVEINYNLVPRGQFEETTLKEGDQIEIVTLVGGGSGEVMS